MLSLTPLRTEYDIGPIPTFIVFLNILNVWSFKAISSIYNYIKAVQVTFDKGMKKNTPTLFKKYKLHILKIYNKKFQKLSIIKRS